MKFIRVLKADLLSDSNKYNKLFKEDEMLDDVINRYVNNEISKEDLLFYMNWNEFDKNDVDWNLIEKEHNKHK